MVHNALICDFLSMKNTEPPLKKNESNSLLADPPQGKSYQVLLVLFHSLNGL